MIGMPRQVDRALAVLTAAGYEAYLVGGAVRDHVKGLTQCHDWDIATNALPADIARVFKTSHIVETGLRHGTVTLITEGVAMEITTYRSGKRVEESPFASKRALSLEEDVSHRDFTVNALAYTPESGIVDLVGGVADIRTNTLRCVGDPVERFREDGLRVLRALRFASVFGMDIEPVTEQAAREHAELLKTVAAERIQAELTKLLCGRDVERVLIEYGDIIAVVLPEIKPMFGFLQHNPHHDKDVWLHTVKVVGASPAQPVLRWTALLHDIGKPNCFTRDLDGIGHFYGHAAKSVDIANGIFKRLRFERASHMRILQLIKYHDMPIADDEKVLKRLLNRFGEQASLQLVAVHCADTIGQHPAYHARLDTYAAIRNTLQKLIDRRACFALKDLCVNGHDMMARGLEGRAIGDALRYLLEAVIDGAVSNERDELLAYLNYNFIGSISCPQQIEVSE